MSSNPFLSVVIPVYNETKRLHNLNRVIDFLKNQPFSSEIIVVNDGSTDQTLPKLKKLGKKIKTLSYSHNQGKGYALKTGVLIATGQYVLIMDVDLSTPLEELKKFKPFLSKYDLVIGTRKIGKSTLIKRQPFIRESMGRVFTFLSNLILGTHVSDFTCGFKCFSKRSAKEIFSRLTINRWGYDSEVIFIGYEQGYKIKEVPVTWKNDPLTKVNLVRDSISSFTELLKIRLNYLKGIYR